MGIEIVEENESRENKLLGFYKSIVASLEEGSLNRDEIESLNDFYIRYKFVNEDTISQDDFLKYMYLGWYIYRLREDLNEEQLSRELSRQESLEN